MPQGGVSGSIVAGGGNAGGANGQAQARQLAILGCSPGGSVGSIYQPGNQPAAAAMCGAGPLLEEDVVLLAVVGVRPAPILVPTAQTVAGAVAGLTANAANVGAGALALSAAPHVPISVLCSTSGDLGVAAFRFAVNGGPYGAPVLSVNKDSATPWSYLVPGTFCMLSFAWGSPTAYTATKTLAIGVDGSVTPGTAWTGTVTQASSPMDTYEIVATVAKGGALGACSLGLSLDGGFSTIGPLFVPASGTVVLTDGHGGGTGLVLTASSTFAAGDSYTGLALPPSSQQADIVTAIQDLIASPSRPTVCAIHIAALPATPTAAFALAQAVDTQMAAAFAAGLDWQAFVEAPVLGDVVMYSGAPIIASDSAVFGDAAIRTARAGITTNRVAVLFGTGGIVSPLSGMKVRRPVGWGVLQRYVGTDPAQSLGRPADGPLNITIGRDEKLAAVQLGDSQLNVLTTYDGYTGAFLNITAGGFALKNLTQSALYQDAETLRALNLVSAAVRVTGMRVLGDRPPVNADGTIAEGAAKAYDTLFDAAVKRAVGLMPGGAFGNVAQASICTAVIDRTSVLGASPRTLKVIVTFQGLGMVSAVSYTIAVQGA